MYTALSAAKTLAARGVEAEVIDLRSLSPWDKATVLESVAKTGRFVAVDESFPVCSAASEWCATVAEAAFHHLRAPVQRVANKDVPMPFSPVLEKAVLPSVADVIEAGGGLILNTAGTFGLRAAKNKAAYSAAKAGLINLTRSIALDYSRDKIRCNVICPGYVDTPLNEGFPRAERDAFLEQQQPLRGLISAEDVAEMAVYLASDAARMITGQIFVIDGGQQAGLFA